MEVLLELNLLIDSKIDNNDGLCYKQKDQKNSHVIQNFIGISISAYGWRDFPLRNLSQNFNYGNIYTNFFVESIKKVCYHDDYDDEDYGDKDESYIKAIEKRLLVTEKWIFA